MALDTLARAMAARADSKAKTAYQYAVEGGYTGTEEQFTEDMGKLGINAEAVDNAVRFDIAQAKTELQKLQAQANIGLNTTDGDINAQLALRALINGYYEAMGVGTADNLTTNLMEQNSYPFNLAPTGGLGKVIEASNRLFLRKVIYGSVVVNQLLKTLANAYTSSNVTFTPNANGSISVSGLCSGSAYPIFTQNIAIEAGHVYMMYPTVTGTTGTGFFGIYSNGVLNLQTAPNVGKIAKATGSGNVTAWFRVINAENYDFTAFVNVVDLTQWYGSTETADHIYAMETNHSGDGVNFFVTQHPQASGYIPFNTGTLCSSKPSFHKTVGIQQWDGVYETGYINTTTGQNTGSSYNRSKNYIRVFPNTEYRMTVSARVFYYGIDNAYLGFDSLGNNADFTTPENCYYIRFCGTSTSPDIKDEFVFIHWDRTMDGSPTEDYNEHSYPIDDTIDGHGIFKFKKVGGVLTDNLYVDGDELTSDGTLAERYGIVNMKDLTWTKVDGNNYCNWQGAGIVNSIVKDVTKCYTICTKYISYSSNSVPALSEMTLYINGSGYVRIRNTAFDSYTQEQVTAAMDGVWFVYELADPTTSQKDPYTEVQACDNWGYEYYNDAEYDAGNRAVQIPVGNVTDYPANLKDKVEAYPDLPADDGDYILNKNGSSYTFKKLGSAFPTMPTTDGTYSLKATVSSGTATMSWGADT